ncbi:nuclear transport factor 2 family protein [Spirosoma sp. KCTC 42546]|uniref:YybH family protein n=1 Tax=Spirosoma sp. KCTC 42546 TaxID=2520506 RepID=UPI00115944F9|nr:nuclear transport factor 2 family protein [Spirosoma sp. KCTC 42546]QDK81678.1 nuclear transport factor 2 family protein [Spirosoma sp. KCTC 42546]
MNRLYIVLVLSFIGWSAFGQQTIEAQSKQVAKERRTILQILERQTSDWNSGRVDKFMNGYWVSDSLTFVGKAGVTYGYQATLANYKKRYPSRASMGSLKFDILQLDFLTPDVAYVIGRFHLTRPKIGDADGHFTLLWRKIKNRWVIVSDHSS